ncbi:hypothetical protein QQ045_004387 [Rhodiola kirilowii]
MESPAMVPQGKKTKKSFIMSLYRYAARANKVSQKPEPQATPISSKKVNIMMTRQLSCHDTNVNKSGSAVYQERRLVSCCNEGEISKQKSKMLVAVEGGRRSVSQVETSLKSVISFLQVKVMVTDMPGFMQVHAFKVARTSYDSLDKLSSKHIAFDIKKEFDRAYGPAWHCIVGSGFGSFVTHSTGGFLYFSMDKLCILLFQTKVLKASSR